MARSATTSARESKPGLLSRMSLASRFIALFCLLFAVTLLAVEFIGLAGLPWSGDQGRIGRQRSEVFDYLSLVADLKKERLLRWFKELQVDARFFAGNALFFGEVNDLRTLWREEFARTGRTADAAGRVMASEEYARAYHYLQAVLRTYELYSRIDLIDADSGVVFASTQPDRVGLDRSDRNYFQGAIIARGYYVGGVRADEEGGGTVLFTSHLIRDRSNNVLAVMAMAVKTEDEVKPILHTGDGLGASGEAVLVDQDLHNLTSLKHPLPDGRRPGPLEIVIKARPAVLAASGQEGVVDAVDYRGVRVLAAYRHIRISSDEAWGMVVKQDRNELFRPLRMDIYRSLVVGLAGMALLAVITVFLVRRLARPLVELSRTAEKVARGELSARAPVESGDEIGQLARTFNAMVGRLEDWHRELEGQVTARTAELDAKNRLLQDEIEERHLTEEGLRESEARFRELAEMLPETVFEADAQGRITFVNRRGLELFGYDSDDLDKGLTVFDMILAEERGKADEKIEQVKDGQSIGLSEYTARRKDGSRFPVMIHSAPIVRHGQDLGLRGFIVDVSSLAQAERDLRESEEKYRVVVENAGDAIFIAQDGLLRFVNREAETLSGFSRKELLTRHISDLIHPDDRALVLERHRQRQQGLAVPTNYSFRILDKSGTAKWVELNAVVVDWLGQSATLNFLRDITERREAEEKVRALSARQEAMLGAIPDIIMEVDENKVYTWANQAGLDFFGSDVIGREAAEYFEGEQNTYTEVKPLFNGHQNVIYVESWQRRFDGERRLLAWWCRVLKDSDGEVIGALSTARDVTERQLAQEEKEKLQAQLLQAQKMESVGTLAGGVAHDFNNLLQAINGYTQILLMDTDEDAPAHRSLIAIQKAGERASVLVKQLLLFSRKAETERKPVNLNHEVEHANRLLERTIPKMIDIEIRAHKGLWNIVADPVQIEQVLLNLGSNAADAMPEGGRLVIETENITLDEEYAAHHLGALPGRYVLLTVTDTGLGMDKETVEHVFEPFYTTKEIGKGTGLGLASVYGIVKSHGGYITCYSELGRGTTFKLYLPAVKPAYSDEGHDAAPAAPRGGSETIMIVDDEAAIRDFACQAFKKFGYQVLTASSGEEALEIYTRQAEGIDLLIMDIGMPGMGGYKCLREIIGFNPAAKVLVASGYSIEGQVSKTLEAGAAGYVAKPYQLTDLMAKVRDVLDGPQ